MLLRIVFFFLHASLVNPIHHLTLYWTNKILFFQFFLIEARKNTFIGGEKNYLRITHSNLLFQEKKLIQILLNSFKLETRVTFYNNVFNIYNHKSFEETMKDKAKGNIESIKWWPRIEHPFCQCYSSDARYYPSWHDTGNGQRFRTGSRVKKKNDQILC